MIESTDKKTLQEKVFRLDIVVASNLKKVGSRSLYLPIIILIAFIVYFSLQSGSSFTDNYINCQKDLFFFINNNLARYSYLQNNFTQLGDAIIIFPFVFFLLFLAPKFWEVLITSSIFNLIFSAVLKRIFAIPRPAAMWDIETFTIVGRPNILHTSLPSGHSMTAFMVITVVLYAFMPKKMAYKVIWSIGILSIGFIIALSRVAIGAHYPFDVIIGSILGFIIAIIAIRLNSNYSWLHWMKYKRFYPVIMLILLIWTYLISLKIYKHNWEIFYISLIATLVTFVIILRKYVKKY